jgi:hypothetical protein
MRLPQPRGQREKRLASNQGHEPFCGQSNRALSMEFGRYQWTIAFEYGNDLIGIP